MGFDVDIGTGQTVAGTSMTLDQRLAEIRGRAESATDGPWMETFWRGEIEWPDGKIYRTVAGSGPNHKSTQGGLEKSCNDMQFIAHSRTDVPFLLEVVERLTTQLANESFHSEHCGCTCMSYAPSTEGVVKDLLKLAEGEQ